MARWVLDANVVVKWALAEDYYQIATQFRDGEHDLIAPDVIIWEVLNILVGNAQQRVITTDVVLSMLETIYDRFDLYNSEALLDEAMRLALRLTISLFDAVYLLVAVLEGCPLVTADRRLFNATRPGYSTNVVSLAEVTV